MQPRRESLAAPFLDVRNQAVRGPSEDIPDLLTTNIYTPVSKPSPRPPRPPPEVQLHIAERVEQVETHVRREKKEKGASKEALRRGYEAFIEQLKVEMEETKKAHEKLIEVTASKMSLQRELNALAAELETYRSEKGTDAVKHLQTVIARLTREKRSLQRALETHRQKIERLNMRLMRVTRESAVITSDAKGNLEKLGTIYNKLLDSYNGLKVRADASFAQPQASAELQHKNEELHALLAQNRELYQRLAEQSKRERVCKACSVKDATIEKLVQKRVYSQTSSEQKYDFPVKPAVHYSSVQRSVSPRQYLSPSPTVSCNRSVSYTPTKTCHCDCANAPSFCPPQPRCCAAHAPEYGFNPPPFDPRVVGSYTPLRHSQYAPAPPGPHTALTVNGSAPRRVLHSQEKRSYAAVQSYNPPRQVVQSPHVRQSGYKYSLTTAGTTSPVSAHYDSPSFTTMAAAAAPPRQISLLNSTDYREIVNRRKLIDQVFGREEN